MGYNARINHKTYNRGFVDGWYASLSGEGVPPSMAIGLTSLSDDSRSAYVSGFLDGLRREIRYNAAADAE